MPSEYKQPLFFFPFSKHCRIPFSLTMSLPLRLVIELMVSSLGPLLQTLIPFVHLHRDWSINSLVGISSAHLRDATYYNNDPKQNE